MILRARPTEFLIGSRVRVSAGTFFTYSRVLLNKRETDIIIIIIIITSCYYFLQVIEPEGAKSCHFEVDFEWYSQLG